MKRLTLALGLLLSLGLGLLGHGVAQAAPPTDCKLYTTGGTGWPNGFYYQCSPQNDKYYANEAQSTYSVLASNNNAYFFQQLQKEAVPFYFYPSSGYFSTDFPKITLPVPDAGYYNAVTVQSNGAPVESAVFEELANGTLVDVENASAHELGHWMDYFLRSILNAASFASNSVLYQDSIAQDWKYFNSLPACAAPNEQTGVTGVFYGEKDYSSSVNSAGVYICANNGTGPGLASGYSGTNQAILEKIDALIYNNANGQRQDIFAEELAVVLGYNKLQISQPYLNMNDWDHYMNPGVDSGLFACSKNVVASLFYYGTKPQSFPSGCPTS